MPTTAAITAVAAAMREQISEKDLEDYTNQNAGGGVVDEDTDITTNLAKAGIRLANMYCAFGGGFNENNDIHLEAAVYGGLIKFFERCKKFENARNLKQTLKELGDMIRGARRVVDAGSVRIAGDADDRELGDDFAETFMRKQGSED